MKNKELYDKTISILVKAYLNDTLEHGNYCGCAVGNLIADGMGFKLTVCEDESGYNRIRWDDQQEIAEHWFGFIAGGKFNKKLAEEHILSTGYTGANITDIEHAFESIPYNTEKYERMYLGLMEVVSVLGQIHEVEKEAIEETKLLFTK
jgi:hypothetical protein